MLRSFIEVERNRPDARDQLGGVEFGAERGSTQRRFSKFAGVMLALAIGTAGYGQGPGSVSMDSSTPPKVAIDPTHKFPLWYADAENPAIKLEPCLDTNKGGCTLLPDPGYDPTKILNFPGNFPSEWFYYVVDSDKIPTKGCQSAKAGLVKYRAAIEGTFLNGTVQPTQQITFGRTKIVASGLCPNAPYTFTHPYGTDPLTTDSSGQVVANKKGGTIDVGCGTTPCDFTVASQSRVLGGFLRRMVPSQVTITTTWATALPWQPSLAARSESAITFSP